MALLKTTFKFSLPEDEAQWRVVVNELFANKGGQQFVVTRNGALIFDQTFEASANALSTVRELHLPEHDLKFEFGAISMMKYGLIVARDNDVVWRSTDKPFRTANKFDAILEKVESLSEGEISEEKQAMLDRQKKLRPSIFIDICFGVLFFFVAREFGLVTAALTGACATLVLFAVQPFVKWDLLGGFAVFGVVMSLISAGIAWGFQDDLAVKLRGTWMALIGAGFGLYDAFILNGGYLGKRMAMYMEGIGKLNPKRASLALVGSTLILMGIDTPLAFILTTDQWIWYNSVFDMFIAIPIVLGCMYWAREKPIPNKPDA